MKSLRLNAGAWLLVSLGLTSAVVAACGSEGDPGLIPSVDDEGGTTDAAGNTGDATGTDDGASSDGAPADGSGGDGASGDGAPDGCVPAPNDPKNCGACGVACAAGQVCSNAGKCECPPYQGFCAGTKKCVPVANDPSNCGACGKQCLANEVCSAGACIPAATGCIPGPAGGQPGLTACSGACVDLLNDNKNCGACGTVCPPAQGCVNGACVPSTVFAAPAMCSSPAGGPPIVLPGQGCLGKMAQTTFRWGLCSCKDIKLTASLTTDGYDSTKGPYPPSPKQLGGGVGLNGDYVGPMSNPVDIGGALWSTGVAGLASRGPTTIRQEGHVQGPMSAVTDPLKVLEDAYVGGDMSATSGGTITVGTMASPKTLRLRDAPPPAAVITTPTTVTAPGGTIVSTAVKVDEPCECSPSQKIPVAAIVDAAALSNDNALIGLDKDLLATPNAAAASVRLDLPCGRYYLSKINKPGSSVTIFAHGRTALFIDGDAIGQVVSFVLDPTGEFDVFIKGTVTTGGELIIGSPNWPALSRTYVAGSATLFLSGEAGRLGGNLYAANALVSVTSHLGMYGALYAGDFKNQETADIHYDRNVLSAAAICPPPPGSGKPDAGADASAPDASAPDASTGTSCGTCKDCGNQACIAGKCGACTNSGQCCAPLVCIGGTCKVSP
jgi:hypothetical protein